MALNKDVLGHKTKPLVHEYKWQDTVLYALGVGAQTRELDYLIEMRGPKVLPTYAVIPTYEACKELFEPIGGNMLGVVHGGQKIQLHKPFAPNGKLTTVGTVSGIYDLKRMATVQITTETHDEGGDLVCETEWSIIYRLDGGFGGEPPPKKSRVRPPEREADFTVEHETAPEQALLYRLNGDYNPLHADPEIGKEVGFGGPILHGLCTYGYVGRAILEKCCDGDPSRLKSLSGQFRKPVWPGDTLITKGWRENGIIVIGTSVKGRPEEFVFSNAKAEVA